MKLKATKKEMRNGYDRIITIGYCDAQHLLNYVDPFAYSASGNGWDCDYYDVKGVLICTGYRPISAGNVIRDYDTVTAYDKRAEAISYSGKPYEERAAEVNALLFEMVATLTAKAVH